jgi:hypothetical protein
VVTLAPRLTTEQAAAVIRRAAELEAASTHGDAHAVLDDAALEDIGRDVGLSPASVRAALVELRRGLGGAAPPLEWGTVLRCRTLRTDRACVEAFLDDEARQGLLTLVERDTERGVMVWEPHAGATAAMVRSLRGRRRYPLLALTALRATITQQEPGLVRVALEGSLRFPVRLLSPRSLAFASAGIACGAYVAFRVTGAGNLDWALDTTGVLLSTAGIGAGVHGYRDAVTDAEGALAAVLDRLAHGVHRLRPAQAPLTPGEPPELLA